VSAHGDLSRIGQRPAECLLGQAQMLARQGLAIGREVLADWIGTAAQEIAPVVRRLREILLASPRLFADETTMPVLDPGRGQVKKGFAWVIARDDRPWGGHDPPAVVFRYAPGRGKEHAAALLAGYRGILQCDGYAAYKAQATGAGATLAFCWSHVRRGFYDLARGGAAPVAVEALARIGELYAIEAEIRGRPAPERQATRAERSRPLVEPLFTWLEAQLARLPASSPTAEAIRYALNHRDGLVRFLDDGRIEADTNTVERAIRPICLSRKNALFASGDDGGAHHQRRTEHGGGCNPSKHAYRGRVHHGWVLRALREHCPAQRLRRQVDGRGFVGHSLASKRVGEQRHFHAWQAVLPCPIAFAFQPRKRLIAPHADDPHAIAVDAVGHREIPGHGVRTVPGQCVVGRRVVLDRDLVRAMLAEQQQVVRQSRTGHGRVAVLRDEHQRLRLGADGLGLRVLPDHPVVFVDQSCPFADANV
jgi:hypothetical protein